MQAVTYNFARVGIRNQGEISKAVYQPYIGDITNPHLFWSHDDDILNEVWMFILPMPGIGGNNPSLALPDQQLVLL